MPSARLRPANRWPWHMIWPPKPAFAGLRCGLLPGLGGGACGPIMRRRPILTQSVDAQCLTLCRHGPVDWWTPLRRVGELRVQPLEHRRSPVVGPESEHQFSTLLDRALFALRAQLDVGCEHAMELNQVQPRAWHSLPAIFDGPPCGECTSSGCRPGADIEHGRPNPPPIDAHGHHPPTAAMNLPVGARQG